MSHFPEINASGESIEGDFLAREKELLGEDAQQFQTEQDQAQQEEDDVAQFEEQFPEVEESAAIAEPVEHEQEEEEPAFNPPSTSKGPSSALEEWKSRFDLEIQQRDAADAEKTEKTRAAAEAQLDDFYEAYNAKKEEQHQKALKAQEELLEKRDTVKDEGVWGRAAQLAKGKGNDRFREVLEARAKLEASS